MNQQENSDLEQFRLKWQQELTNCALRSEVSTSKTSFFAENTVPKNLFSIPEDGQIDNAKGKNIVPIKRTANVKTSSEIKTPEAGQETCDTEEKARFLFSEGVKYERSGKLVEAIRFYKKAVQLDSDVERKMYEESKRNTIPIEEVLDNTGEEKENIAFVSDANDNGDDMDLSNLTAHYQKLSLVDRRVCLPQIEPDGLHISALPAELIIHILKWVVSADLDVRSLEQSARVCRGFYLCCRDQEIWKLVCQKVWGPDCGSPVRYGYNSWRSMHIERPRLQYHGCYISKTSYVRPGENSFQDSNYQPWHFIQYFRYLRFFPGGLVLMVTTSEEPANTVGTLKKSSSALSSHPSLLTGHYILKASIVYVTLKRAAPQASNLTTNKYRRRGRELPMKVEQGDQTFEMELELKPHKKYNNGALHWVRYVVRTGYPAGPNGPIPESVASFPIIPNKFPSFWFSRVRSYTAEAESAL